MNFLFFIVILIALFFCYNLYKTSKIEGYKNYKEVLVEPTHSVLYPLTLNYVNLDNTLNSENIQKFSQIFPFNPSIVDGTLTVMDLVNNNPNHLGLATLDVLTDQIYHHKAPYDNIRIICGFSVVKPLMLVRTNAGITKWKDLENKIITFGWPQMGWERIGTYFLNFAKIKNIDVVDGYYTFEEIEQGFINNEIDAFFCVTQDPNSNLYNMISKDYCNLLSFDFNFEIVNTFFPTWEETKIDLTNYSTSVQDTINSYKIKNCLICHKDLSDEIVGKILNSFIGSQLLFKTSLDNFYNNLSMLDFNPNDIFLNIEVVPQHDGVHKYLKEIGIYTNNSSPYCVFSAGTGKCDFSKLGEFRLLY
jgi:TRAP-type uncharacterized transport system substrate-binding protein